MCPVHNAHFSRLYAYEVTGKGVRASYTYEREFNTRLHSEFMKIARLNRNGHKLVAQMMETPRLTLAETAQLVGIPLILAEETINQLKLDKIVRST
jgi:hypothetical protein